MKDIGVLATVFDEQRRILLVHQSYRGGKWVSPGGGVEPGEAPWVAAVRETKEETGLEVEVERLVSVYYFADREALSSQFLCRRTGGQLAADGQEIIQADFCDPANPPSPMTINGQQRLADALAGSEQPFLRFYESVQVIRPDVPGGLVVDDPSGHSHRNAKTVLARGVVLDVEERVLLLGGGGEPEALALPQCEVQVDEAPWQSVARHVAQVAGAKCQVMGLAGLVFFVKENTLLLEFLCRLENAEEPRSKRSNFRFIAQGQLPNDLQRQVAQALVSGRGRTYFDTIS